MKEIKMLSAVGINVGKVRENNEDNFYFNGRYLSKKNREKQKQFSRESADEFQMYAVCDGMGGEECGEEASLIAVQTLKKYKDMFSSEKYTDINKYMEKCLVEASDLVYEKSIEMGKKRSGTTVALLCFLNDVVHIYNVGDSRVYRLHNNRLKQVTEDHTQVMRGIKMGTIKPEEAKTHPHRNKLTQFLGISSEEMIITPYTADFKVCNKDIYLICTDGITDMVEDDEIEMILKQKISEKEKVNLLIEKAMDNGGKDNATAILLRIESKTKFKSIFKTKEKIKKGNEKYGK